MSIFGDIGHWIGGAVKTAGKGIGSAIHAVNVVTGDIADAAGKVPGVGPLFHGVLGAAFGPFRVTDNVASGVRLDKVVSRELEAEVKNIKEVAPYAQMVLSLVPAIGPVASGAISAGLTLAEGQPITKALLSGVKGALPGGPLAAAAFDVAESALSGKSLSASALAALPIPKAAQTLLAKGLEVSFAVANGKRLDSAVLTASIALLPPAAQKAANAARDVAGGANLADLLLTEATKSVPGLSPDVRKGLSVAVQSGIALGHGQSLQRVATKALTSTAVQNKLLDVGRKMSGADTVLHAGADLVGKAGEKGFHLAAGLMSHAVGPHAMLAAREALSKADQHGFDAGVSLHVGRVVRPAPAALGLSKASKTMRSQAKPVKAKAAPRDVKASSKAAAAYFITHGMRGAAPAQKTALMTTLVTHPEARAGAALAVKSVGAARLEATRSFLDVLLEFLGLVPKPRLLRTAASTAPNPRSRGA